MQLDSKQISWGAPPASLLLAPPPCHSTPLLSLTLLLAAFKMFVQTDNLCLGATMCDCGPSRACCSAAQCRWFCGPRASQSAIQGKQLCHPRASHSVDPAVCSGLGYRSARSRLICVFVVKLVMVMYDLADSVRPYPQHLKPSASRTANTFNEHDETSLWSFTKVSSDNSRAFHRNSLCPKTIVPYT